MTFTYPINNNKLAGSWEQELHLQKVSTPLAQFNSYAEPRTFFLLTTIQQNCGKLIILLI